MAKFVRFLRGVNVGGVKILMKDLASLLSDAGYRQVKTVLASGNAIMEAPHDDASLLREHCEALLAQHYSRAIPCLVFTAQEVHELSEDFPVQLPDTNHEYHRYLSLCTSQEDSQQLQLAATALDPAQQTALRGRALCWVSPKGQSLETPVAKLVAAQSRKYLITTRNLNTLVKLSTIIRAQ
jgi:Uncharacterized protein conserved in bacteria